jgi:hypothetical protein
MDTYTGKKIIWKYFGKYILKWKTKKSTNIWQPIFLAEIAVICKCFPHVHKMPTITYNQSNSVITQKSIILNNTHTICNRCDTDVVICRILVVWKSADGFAIFWILNSKTMVNLEPRFNCQYHLSSSVRNWQNISQPFSETTKLIETTLWMKSKIATNAVEMFYWWSGASLV